MGLLDAKEYDPRPRQRMIRLILGAIAVVIVSVVAYFLFRYQPEKNVVISKTRARIVLSIIKLQNCPITKSS